ncbi:VOC family protein [Exiguobacterium flavidum]|uniref:VOC family protein n=1 Tax=Exiguobacterium flavidum TaxID=2184695 RepID=UPI001300334B|nr:VOC family protein [Exiguobacterium flavidum]
MKTFIPFLMYKGNASEALSLYQSLFPNCRLIERQTYADGKVPGNPSHILRASLEIDGQLIYLSDSLQVKRDDAFVPVLVTMQCEAKEEVERLFHALSEGGQIVMPLQDQFWNATHATVIDRFGITWQLFYPH